MPGPQVFDMPDRDRLPQPEGGEGKGKGKGKFGKGRAPSPDRNADGDRSGDGARGPPADGAPRPIEGRGGKGKGGGAGQQIKVEFYPDPSTLTPPGMFTPPYDPAQQAAFASLNAGDGRLFVGGATMNKAFAVVLDAAGQTSGNYQRLHEGLFSAGQATPGELVQCPPEILAEDPNVQAAFVQVAPPAGSDPKVGVAFIDVFKPDKCPHGSEKNIAMVYTVGAQRDQCASDSAFVAELRNLGKNVASAISKYNTTEGAGPKIEKIRICLVSGGAFAGSVPKEQVAAAILQGVKQGPAEAAKQVAAAAYAAATPGTEAQRSASATAGVLAGAPIFEFAFDGQKGTGGVFKQEWDRMHA